MNPTSPRPFSIVALGTSLTAGIDWQTPLAREIGRTRGDPVRVTALAEGGRTSRWGLAQLDRIAALAPDAAIVEFAMNDANWRRVIGPETSRANAAAIAAGLRGRIPGIRIVLMITNPVHGWRGLMRPCIGMYYEGYRHLAAAEGLDLIDPTPGWLSLSREERRRAIPDGVHPTLRAFTRIALPCVTSAFLGCHPPETRGA